MKRAESILQAIVKRKIFYMFLNEVIIIIILSRKIYFIIFPLNIL